MHPASAQHPQQVAQQAHQHLHKQPVQECHDEDAYLPQHPLLSAAPSCQQTQQKHRFIPDNSAAPTRMRTGGPSRAAEVQAELQLQAEITSQEPSAYIKGSQQAGGAVSGRLSLDGRNLANELADMPVAARHTWPSALQPVRARRKGPAWPWEAQNPGHPSVRVQQYSDSKASARSQMYPQAPSVAPVDFPDQLQAGHWDHRMTHPDEDPPCTQKAAGSHMYDAELCIASSTLQRTNHLLGVGQKDRCSSSSDPGLHQQHPRRMTQANATAAALGPPQKRVRFQEADPALHQALQTSGCAAQEECNHARALPDDPFEQQLSKQHLSLDDLSPGLCNSPPPFDSTFCGPNCPPGRSTHWAQEADFSPPQQHSFVELAVCGGHPNFPPCPSPTLSPSPHQDCTGAGTATEMDGRNFQGLDSPSGLAAATMQRPFPSCPSPTLSPSPQQSCPRSELDLDTEQDPGGGHRVPADSTPQQPLALYSSFMSSPSPYHPCPLPHTNAELPQRFARMTAEVPQQPFPSCPSPTLSPSPHDFALARHPIGSPSDAEAPASLAQLQHANLSWQLPANTSRCHSPASAAGWERERARWGEGSPAGLLARHDWAEDLRQRRPTEHTSKAPSRRLMRSEDHALCSSEANFDEQLGIRTSMDRHAVQDDPLMSRPAEPLQSHLELDAPGHGTAWQQHISRQQSGTKGAPESHRSPDHSGHLSWPLPGGRRDEGWIQHSAQRQDLLLQSSPPITYPKHAATHSADAGACRRKRGGHGRPPTWHDGTHSDGHGTSPRTHAGSLNPGPVSSNRSRPGPAALGLGQRNDRSPQPAGPSELVHSSPSIDSLDQRQQTHSKRDGPFPRLSGMRGFTIRRRASSGPCGLPPSCTGLEDMRTSPATDCSDQEGPSTGSVPLACPSGWRATVQSPHSHHGGAVQPSQQEILDDPAELDRGGTKSGKSDVMQADGAMPEVDLISCEQRESESAVKTAQDAGVGLSCPAQVSLRTPLHAPDTSHAYRASHRVSHSSLAGLRAAAPAAKSRPDRLTDASSPTTIPGAGMVRHRGFQEDAGCSAAHAAASSPAVGPNPGGLCDVQAPGGTNMLPASTGQQQVRCSQPADELSSPMLTVGGDADASDDTQVAAKDQVELVEACPALNQSRGTTQRQLPSSFLGTEALQLVPPSEMPTSAAVMSEQQQRSDLNPSRPSSECGGTGVLAGLPALLDGNEALQKAEREPELLGLGGVLQQWVNPVIAPPTAQPIIDLPSLGQTTATLPLTHSSLRQVNLALSIKSQLWLQRKIQACQCASVQTPTVGHYTKHCTTGCIYGYFINAPQSPEGRRHVLESSQ